MDKVENITIKLHARREHGHTKFIPVCPIARNLFHFANKVSVNSEELRWINAIGFMIELTGQPADYLPIVGASNIKKGILQESFYNETKPKV